MNSLENDLQGKPVLITGGTMGIGLATGLTFGRLGAQCIITHRWGTAETNEVRAAFADAGASAPTLVQADVSLGDDRDALLAAMRREHNEVEVLVSNVTAAPVISSLDDYTWRALSKTIEYSAWPNVEYTRGIKACFGRYPRYVIGLSSTGVDSFALGYDFVAASKAVMETLCRYMNYRLFDDDVRINVIRSRAVRTDSYAAHFGHEFDAFARRFTRERHYVQPEEVANAAVALCSGLMDGVSGQVLTVDRGTSFFDNFMRLFEERDELGL